MAVFSPPFGKRTAPAPELTRVPRPTSWALPTAVAAVGVPKASLALCWLVCYHCYSKDCTNIHRLRWRLPM